LKKKFIACYTNQVMHFGNTSTSRAEGNHSQVKRSLCIVNGDLLSVVQRTKLIIEIKDTEIHNEIEEQKYRRCRRHLVSILSNVIGKVSWYALDLFLVQLHGVSDAATHPVCTGNFTRSIGILCAHKIQELLDCHQPLLVSHFHEHWLLDRSADISDNAYAISPQSPRRMALYGLNKRCILVRPIEFQ